MSCVLVDVVRAGAMVHAVPNSEQAPREECDSGLWTRGEDLVPPSTLALAETCLPGQRGPSPLQVLSFVGSGGTFYRLCLLSMEEANLRPRPGTGAGTVSAGLQLVPVCVCVCSGSRIYAKGAELPGRLWR